MMYTLAHKSQGAFLQFKYDRMRKIRHYLKGRKMIGFYHENEAFGCFSNWYPAEFDYAGQHYVNSEQFMMYHKVLMFRKYDFAQQIIQTNDPAICKKIAGQKYPEFDSDLWNKTSYAIVKRGIKAKFAQNKDICIVQLLQNQNTTKCSKILYFLIYI